MSLRAIPKSTPPFHQLPSLLSSLSLGSKRTYITPRRAPVLDPLHAQPRKQAGPAFDPIRTDPPSEQPEWTPLSRRSGVIGVKTGMSTIWDSRGQAIPVTIVQLKDCQVVGVIPERPGKLRHPSYYTLQVGAVNHRKYIVDPEERRSLGLLPTHKTKPYNKVPSEVLGQFTKVGLEPKKVVQEFKISKDALLPIGATFNACHFVPGQFVDVKATSKGKGTAGVMKRWGFSGGNASHGASKSHRSAGSTGQNQTPGRVFPGKKAAGRMGNTSVTTQNLLVQRIDTTLNLVFVKGHIPGPPNGFVRLTDSMKGVRRVGKANALEGISPALPDVTSLPFPFGGDELAAQLPIVVDAAPRPMRPKQLAL